ncbi:MAG TPA: hypothetical protein VET30_04720 [Pseudoxanthomonas sp.]|nr:hypothetical protein [Pseudoxanthomonas sp.]
MTRRRKIALLVIAAVLLVLALVLRWLLNPGTLVPALLGIAGKSLGLEITASGVGEYRLRGTPQLIARDVVVREPGAKTAVLSAERVLVSVPWSTLRARGSDLTADRLELDAPVLDAAAFQHWQSKRPPGKTPIPTLSRGIGIVRGQVVGVGWKIDGLHAELPSLAPEQPVRAHVRGRYVDNSLRIPVDVHTTLTKPASGAGIGVYGQISPESATWRLPSRITLSAKLRTEAGIHLQNAVLGARSRYVAGDTTLPFALGVAGPLQFDSKGITLQPAGLSLLGEGAMPTLGAAGGFSLTDRLHLDFEGTLANWPSAWPALPPPLGQSTSPLPFALDYEGKSDLSSVASLKLQRDDTVFHGRFHLFEVMDWVDAGAKGSPLPPIAGTLKTPKLEVSGAVLEGVELQLDDPSIPAPAAIE